jgi:CheY-like chemotaxis protein
LKILLAEDDPINLKLMARLLTKHNFEFITANNGQTAFEIAISDPTITLILMDIQMPVLTGYETATKIREWETENGREPVKIIALTAHTFDEEKQKCRDAGMNDFITKPINMLELITKMNS